MGEIYIIRHCLAQGLSQDASLTQEGKKQAESLVDFFKDIKIDLWIFRLKTGHRVGQQDRTTVIGDAEADGAADIALDIIDGVIQLAPLLHGRARIVEKYLSAVCQSKRGASLKQACTKLLFDEIQTAAERLRCNGESGRSFGDVSLFVDCKKILGL